MADVEGLDQLAAMESRLDNLEPLLTGPLVDAAHASFMAQFMTAGAYGGTPWPMLAESTMRRKPGHSAELLVETESLRTSLTERDAPGGYVEVLSPTEVAVGTTLAYATYHQHGTARMPARPLVPLAWPDDDLQQVSDLTADYIATGAL